MAEGWDRVGPIVRLQVQRAPLTTTGTYLLGPLLEVSRLSITSNGAFGMVDGEWLMDVHHREHPDTRNRRGRNPLSIGLTAHYRRMAERFGPTDPGLAGENLVVECPDPLGLSDLEGGLAIRTAAGEEMPLGGIRVCEPCVPFTRFVSGRGEADREDLEFLRHGTRGFLVAPDSLPRAVEVAIGDVLWRRPGGEH